MTNIPDFSEFDEIGVKPTTSADGEDNSSVKKSADGDLKQAASISPQGVKDPTKESSAKPDQQDKQKKAAPRTPVSPKRMVLGCLVFFFALFGILIVAMIFGLRAGEETIIGFGLNPVSFKNWTIGMVSVLFGSLALTSVISIVYHIGERVLTSKDNLIAKAKAGMKGLISGMILVVMLGMWFFIYNYISKFEMKPPELPIEIVTNPMYTYELTSPIQVEFSAERITDKFKKTYDLVSYEWDKEADGQVDTTGQKVSLYFPHGGKNNGVYDVALRVKLQPKGGGDTLTKEYKRTISISKQELYGEIEVDRESGEVPLTVKLDAERIADPDGAQITSYRWDLDGDGRSNREGFVYRSTEWTFDTIGEHIISLTVTSEDFNEDGTHEAKIFTKKIIVHEPAGSVDTEVWIEASPKKGFSPLTVKFDALQKSHKSKNSRIDKYEWKIGDGLEVLRGQHSSFTFEKPGVYPVELTTTFSNGQVKRDMVEIVVNDESIAPEAAIKTDPNISNQYKAVVGPAPLRVKFDASESKDADENIVKYDWDFDGDGEWDAEGSVTEYEFLNTGDYKTVLRITDSNENKSRAEVLVRVGEELATIDFGASKLSGPAPLEISFDASGSRAPKGKEIISYEWDFNPNLRGSRRRTFIYDRAQTSHIFNEIDEHFVKLILHTDDGSEYFDILKVIATYPSLNAEFSASRLDGDAPLAISLDASESTGNISKYEWIFNDGETSTEKTLTHIFEKAGTYEVVLKVHDLLNNISQTSKTVVVN